jgi:hypothetical protein
MAAVLRNAAEMAVAEFRADITILVKDDGGTAPRRNRTARLRSRKAGAHPRAAAGQSVRGGLRRRPAGNR